MAPVKGNLRKFIYRSANPTEFDMLEKMFELAQSLPRGHKIRGNIARELKYSRWRYGKNWTFWGRWHRAHSC